MAMYVSHYELYPIYEPAEGGYYYDGIRLISSRSAATLAKAKEILAAEALDLEFKTSDSGRIAADVSYRLRRYIGEGEFLIIEYKKGQHESGWRPYE